MVRSTSSLPGEGGGTELAVAFSASCRDCVEAFDSFVIFVCVFISHLVGQKVNRNQYIIDTSIYNINLHTTLSYRNALKHFGAL